MFFGLDASKGFEANWIQMTESEFWMKVRFYGLDFDRLEKTWTIKRPEKIN